MRITWKGRTIGILPVWGIIRFILVLGVPPFVVAAADIYLPDRWFHTFMNFLVSGLIMALYLSKGRKRL